MHAPDGFLNPWVAGVTALMSLVAIAAILRASGRELAEREVPIAGLAAAFIFSAQMVNFPVAAGTTGHLVGACLAAILLGPTVGSLVVAVVVVVQALVFADGGVTALGYNVLNMAIVPAFGGWAVYWLIRRVMPRSASGVIAASALASAASVVFAAGAFSLEWLFGATAPVPFDTVFAAMVGVHTLIGVGEGLISGLVVAAVLASRPDLVAGARDLTNAELTYRPRVRARVFVIAAFFVTVFIAAVGSQFAGSAPDGLERVAADQGFLSSATRGLVDNGVFAGYATAGINDARVSLAIAGLTGVMLTMLVGYGAVSASRHLRSVPR